MMINQNEITTTALRNLHMYLENINFQSKEKITICNKRQENIKG